MIDLSQVENDPFLIQLREELTELEQRKDALFRARQSEPNNARIHLSYDAVMTVWARKYNDYESALRAVLLP